MALSAGTKKTLKVIGWIAFSLLALFGLYRAISPGIYRRLLAKHINSEGIDGDLKAKAIAAYNKMSLRELQDYWLFIDLYVIHSKTLNDSSPLLKKVEAIESKYNLS